MRLASCGVLWQAGMRGGGFGEVLNGDRMVLSAYDLSFRVSREKETLCKRTLTPQEVAQFRESVKNDYYFQVCKESRRTSSFQVCVGSRSPCPQRVSVM